MLKRATYKQTSPDLPLTSEISDVYGSEYFVRRMHVGQRLTGHRGCVNTLDFDTSGQWLVSGSDDCRLNIWRIDNFNRSQLAVSLPTAHEANIFCSRFMPFTPVPEKILSGAADGRVVLTSLDRVPLPRDFRTIGLASTEYVLARPFQCHAGLVMDCQWDPLNPHSLALSCSEDGTVNLYDFRIRTSCQCEGCNRHTYIDVNSAPAHICEDCGRTSLPGCKSASGVRGHHGHGRNPFFNFGRVGVTSMSLKPTNPLLLALGGSDGFVRIFDRRFLDAPIYYYSVDPGADEGAAHADENDPPSINCHKGLVYAFSPSHRRYRMHRNRSNRMNEDLADDSDEEEHDDDSESQWEDMDSEVNEEMEVDDHEMTSSNGSESSSDDDEATSKTSFYKLHKDDIENSGNDIQGLSSVTWNGDRLLCSYLGENIYVICPSDIRTKPWSFRFGPFLAGTNIENEFDDFLKDTSNTLTMPLFSAKDAHLYDEDVEVVFGGHCNARTMIKQATFFAAPNTSTDISSTINGLQKKYNPVPDFVMSGSDDGMFYIWNTRANRPACRLQPKMPSFMLKGDSNIVNCIVTHPAFPMLAVSGIDNDIKLFTPTNGMGYENPLRNLDEHYKSLTPVKEGCETKGLSIGYDGRHRLHDEEYARDLERNLEMNEQILEEEMAATDAVPFGIDVFDMMAHAFMSGASGGFVAGDESGEEEEEDQEQPAPARMRASAAAARRRREQRRRQRQERPSVFMPPPAFFEAMREAHLEAQQDRQARQPPRPQSAATDSLFQGIFTGPAGSRQPSPARPPAQTQPPPARVPETRPAPASRVPTSRSQDAVFRGIFQSASPPAPTSRPSNSTETSPSRSGSTPAASTRVQTRTGRDSIFQGIFQQRSNSRDTRQNNNP